MFASRRVGVVILLLGLGVLFAFAAGYAYGEMVLPADAGVISVGDGQSISLLTGSPVRW